MGSVVYAPLIEQLKKAGMKHVEAVDLLSVDYISNRANLKPNALEGDIKHIESAIRMALSKSRDVVVVEYSYGGTPALYACEESWKAAQPASAPGVLRVALRCSSVTFPGGSIAGDRMEYSDKDGGIDDSGASVKMVREVSCGILIEGRMPDS